MLPIDLKCMLISAVVALVALAGIYKFSTKEDLFDTFIQLRRSWYWAGYNIVEWFWILLRMGILVTFMILGQNIWELYYLSFVSAIAITWVSIKKKMPEFAFYYAFWIWLSCSVIISHLTN
jgi:hypothetical protein